MALLRLALRDDFSILAWVLLCVGSVTITTTALEGLQTTLRRSDDHLLREVNDDAPPGFTSGLNHPDHIGIPLHARLHDTDLAIPPE